MRYHHLGIPTDKQREDEQYLADLKMHVTGLDSLLYGIEWMRFDTDCPLPEIVQNIPHMAFAVRDLDKALDGQEVIVAPTKPFEGVKVAFVIQDGAPVEYMQFDTSPWDEQIY